MLKRATMIYMFASGMAAAEVPNIVTDILPVHSLVAQVMGDIGAPILLTSAGDDPHHMQLRPSQARNLATADAIYWIGPDLTPWLQDAVKALAPDATSTILSAVEGTRKVPVFDQPDTDDPHMWLDPENAILWLIEIAETLGQLDPENRDGYLANARKSAAILSDDTARASDMLADYGNDPIVTVHGFLGYFAAYFGLQISGVLSSGDAPPAAASIRNMRQELAKGEVACVITQPQQNPRVLSTLLSGFDTPSAVLDPLGTEFDPGPDMYRQLLNALAKDLAACIKQ